MSGRALPAGVWRRDRITGGWRYWVTEYRRYSEPDAFRTKLMAAIRGMSWYPPTGQGIPMWPDLGLEEICRQRELKLVAGLGVSSTPLEYPEDGDIGAYLERGREPIWATYTLLGIKQLIHGGSQVSYFLDRGVEIGGIALDFVREARPEGLSVMCALNRHDECSGSVWTRRGLLVPCRTPCVCVCGCGSARRGRGDRAEDAADEIEDLKPDDQVRTVTHEQPPNEE
ncbi:hypothetical protein ACIA8C_26990 [Nocardia sp. NPDC051321]|uniref:hypothetical protein n=1 Tax=Nocardia sp. NPDC051321 TaxID=3364323 RepID=UPI0037AF37C4